MSKSKKANTGTNTQTKSEVQQQAQSKAKSAKPGIPTPPRTGMALSVDLPADVRRGMEALKNSPDVREDRIQELKARIATGNYVADSKAIAARMLGLEQQTHAEQSGDASDNH